ncbi:hypothetical protein F4811DRAFT_510876 [Daldinia bambusicola]|nr:hypothetical protein F4811DRAFT_510876 [Daldinia bambusicola]
MEGTVRLSRVRANTNREQESIKTQRTHPSFRSERLRRHRTEQIVEAVADIRQWRRDHVKFHIHHGDLKKKLEERLDLFHSRVPPLNTRKEATASITSSEKEPPGSPRRKVYTADWRPRLSEKGRGMVRNLPWPVLKESLKPRQKDPLHQWMVDHSGGTIKSSR